MFCKKGWKVASEDIVCWKQLCRGSLFVHTPVMKRIVFPWVLSGKVPYRARGREDIDWRDDNGCWVGGGFVYSYSSRKYVVDDGPGAFAVAYECVIPAGTRYLVSADGNMYASKRLRFMEKVR